MFKRLWPTHAGVVATLALSLAIGGAGDAAAAPAPASGQAPAAGSAGMGDPLFPGLGNGGYDVEHYTLLLHYGSAAPVQRVPAIVTIRARATQALSRFNLDFRGDSVESVEVDDAPAAFSLAGEELVVTPTSAIAEHRFFSVRVHYTSGPRQTSPQEQGDPNALFAKAWIATPSGSITLAQPNSAHRIFPSNDVPSDPATYTIRASTPAGSTFVANGELTEQRTVGERALWTYEQRDPMASELIQLAFGALTVRDHGSFRGVRLRDVVPTSQAAALEPALVRTRAQLKWLSDKIGRYPFRSYGVLMSDVELFPHALETQTLTVCPSVYFLPFAGESFPAPVPVAFFGNPILYEQLMVHELAHQWYGDHVLPARWSDVWLNEGHATWYEWEYAQERNDPGFYLEGGSFESQARAAYARGDQLRAAFGPVAAPVHGADDVASLFSPNVYEGGAVVLYALRQVVGDRTFREIERRWPQRYGGGPAGTADFVALASKVAHRDLTALLTDWLYSTKTPPMPGHPDWNVDPV